MNTKIQNGIFHEIANKNLKLRTFFQILEHFMKHKFVLNFGPKFDTANIFYEISGIFLNIEHFLICEK